MKAMQNFVRRWLRLRPKRKSETPPRSDQPRVEFSYTLYWTKQVRQWDPARRAAITEALEPVLAQPGFEPNAYERRYTVPGLNDLAHAGASLLALKKVLTAFENE